MLRLTGAIAQVEGGMAALGETAPFAPYEWMLASRYLRPKRKEGFISFISLISFLGILLGVATLITVLSVMNGFRQDLYAKLLGLNGHVVITKTEGSFTGFADVAGRLAKAPGVTRVMPVVMGQALMVNADQSFGSIPVYVRGMSAADIGAILTNGAGVAGGTLDGFDAAAGIAIGTSLARDLNVDVGGRVRLITHRGKPTLQGVKPSSRIFTVAAVVDFGTPDANRSLSFLPLAVAQDYFAYFDSVSMLEVRVADPSAVKPVTEALTAAAGPGMEVQDWQERNKSFFNVLDLERDMMFFVVSLIVLVAALNIISGMTMLVQEKTRDIAILRTIGASQGAILRVFLVTGASIGVVGTLMGLVSGLALASNIEQVRLFIQWLSGRALNDGNIYLANQMNARIDPWEVASVLLMALSFSILATLYPAWRASRLDPVTALRDE
jgi:lipoprotein-releasing system permease protein